MNQLAAIPVVFLILSGLSVQLTEIAEQTSDTVISYTRDMQSSLDCAFTGVDVRVCSPELFTYNLSNNLEEVDGVVRNSLHK